MFFARGGERMEKEKPRLSAGRRIWIQNYTTSATEDGNTMRIEFLITGGGMKPGDFDEFFRAIENLCEEISNQSQAL